MAGATSSAALGLLDLPNELLAPIAACLVPVAPSTTRFVLQPNNSWSLKDAAAQYHDWLLSRNDLTALMRVSRRLTAVCRPFLWRSLAIHNADHLVGLLRDVVTLPHVAVWIQEISCLLKLEVAWADHATIQAWNKCPAAVRCQLKSGGGSGGLARVTSLDIFYAIVARAPNLRHLLFAFPDELVSAPWVFTVYEPPPVVMPYLVSSSSRIAAARLPTHPFVPLQTVFSRLTSLRIYHHREGGGGRGLTLTRILADCMLGNITELTALRTLELCCDFINYWPLADLQFPPLPQLHHLRLYGSPIHEPRLVALLLPCVNLESLLVHFEHACDDELDRVELPDGKTLDDALLAISATLTSLELVALDWHGHYLTRGRERPRKRENHRLKCLPQLARVHQLTIDWRSLFGTLGIIDNDDSDRFPSDLFPAALRELTLVCEFGTYKDFKQRHLSNLDAVFMGIEQMCATGAPAGLERVTLAMDPWPKKSRFAARFRRTMVRAGEACAAKGISLRTCDLLPRYRDEDDDEEIGGPEIAEGRGDDGPNRDTDESPEEQYDATSHEDGGGQHTSGCATVAGPADTGGGIVVLPAPWEDGAGAGAEELEEEDEASDYYYSTGDDEADPEREALRPADFGEFMEHLGEGHGHTFDELYYAWHEDRWDEYLF